MAVAELITEEEAVECGLILSKSIESLEHTKEIARLHGDTVASLHRVAAMEKYKRTLQTDNIKALILSAAGDGYEVAESDKFKIPDAIKLQGAVTAMARGYLISDVAGPHFTVILGKGGMSLLIKEAGHRHKMKRMGVRNVDVKAVAVSMREKPNTKDKFEMLIEGSASCEYNGEVFTIDRSGKFPIILPCYETDGPDGLEAKARRRLIRDLWAKVSGEFDAIELEEVDTEAAEQASVTVVDAPKISGVSKAEISFRDERDAVLKITSVDPEWSANVLEAWDAIANAASVDELESLGEVMKDRKTLADNQKLRDKFRLFYNFKKEALS